MSRIRKVTNSLNLDKWKNQNFGTQIEPVACIVSYTKFQKIWNIRLGEKALQTDGQTYGRTDGTEIIGPSGKIPGTKKLSN